MLRRVAVLLFGVLVTFGSVAFADPVPSIASTDDKIVVMVHGLRNNHGSVRCMLYNGAQDFPENERLVIARVRVVPVGNSARCVFDRPARGHDFAVVVHHDENDDAVFQRGTFGIPLEGYGFSNDVRPVLSAPSFTQCRFHFAGGTSILRVAALY
jgi:uncharacterized protein (DUF2141 family)